MYVTRFRTESGRWFTLVASNNTLRNLVNGNPKGGGGELKGCQVEYPGRRKPPFLFDKEKKGEDVVKSRVMNDSGVAV